MQFGTSVVQRSIVLGALVGLFVSATAASAATIDVEFRSDGVLITTLDETLLGAGCTGGGALETCSVSGLAVGDYVVDFTATVGTAGGAIGIFGSGLSVDNTGANDERLTVDIILTTGPVGPSTTSGGSVAPSVTDGITGNPSTVDGSATLSVLAGSALYTASITGTGFSQELFPDPNSFNTSSSTSFAGDSFGIPGNTFPGPGVNSSIRLRYDFTLTPEDQADLTGKFLVVPVPEPSTAMLMALGLLGLAKVTRRR